MFSAVPVSDAQALAGCAMAVVADDSGYAMVWHEYPPPGGNQHSLAFARVSTTGELITGPKRIDFIDARAEAVWLHATNTGYLAFYRDDWNYLTFALDLDRDGNLDNRIDVGSHPGSVTIVDNGAGYGLFYSDKNDEQLYWAPIDTGGNQLEAATALEVPGALWSPSVVHTASGYHIAFMHAWGTDLGYVHLSDGGVILNSWMQSFGSQYDPKIASDQQGRLAITWEDGDQLIEFGLDEETGEQLWNGIRTVVGVNRQESYSPQLAGGDGSIAMVWESDSDTVLPQIAFRTIGLSTFDLGDQQSSKAQLLSNPEYAFSCPRIARGTDHYGVAFRGEVDGTQRVLLGIRHD